MALNIKDQTAERLAAEVAQLTGESKTQAVRVALSERRDRLTAIHHRDHLKAFLEDEVWPQIPVAALGNPITKSEREAILGYGEKGV